MSKKAIIQNNKVANIIEYTGEVGISGLTFPLGTILWDCTYVPVAIGDDFSNGVFTRNGEQVQPVLSAEQQVNELQSQMDAILGIQNESEETV